MNPTPFTIRIQCLESVPPHNPIKQYRLLSVIITCQLLPSGSYQITLSPAVHHNNRYGLATETSVCPSSLKEAFVMVIVIRFVNSHPTTAVQQPVHVVGNSNHSGIGDLQLYIPVTMATQECCSYLSSKRV